MVQHELKRIKLEPVVLKSGFTLGVHPEAMKELGLKPGQVVDGEMMKRILEANARFLGDGGSPGTDRS